MKPKVLAYFCWEPFFVPTVINFTKEVMQIILVENIFTIKLAYILEKYLMKKI